MDEQLTATIRQSGKAGRIAGESAPCGFLRTSQAKYLPLVIVGRGETEANICQLQSSRSPAQDFDL